MSITEYYEKVQKLGLPIVLVEKNETIPAFKIKNLGDPLTSLENAVQKVKPNVLLVHVLTCADVVNQYTDNMTLNMKSMSEVTTRFNDFIQSYKSINPQKASLVDHVVSCNLKDTVSIDIFVCNGAVTLSLSHSVDFYTELESIFGYIQANLRQNIIS